MASLDEIFKKVNKDFKTELVTKGISRVPTSRISFSSPTANYMFFGGIPRGRLTEFCGENSSGKTTSACDIVKNAQILFRAEYLEEVTLLTVELEDTKLSKTARNLKEEKLRLLKIRGVQRIMYVDVENTLDYAWATKIGIDTSEIYLFRPDGQSAEDILQIILDSIDTGQCGLVILDSIPTLVTKATLGKSLDEKAYCGVAGPFTDFVNKLVPKASKHNTTFVGINHVKQVIGSTYYKLHTMGGDAWKYYCSCRIMFKKGAFITQNGDELTNNAENPEGNIVEMHQLKTKFCRPTRRLSRYSLNYVDAICIEIDTLRVALEYDLIHQGGSWFEIPGVEEKIQGKANVIQFLKDNKDVFNEIYDKVCELVVKED